MHHERGQKLLFRCDDFEKVRGKRDVPNGRARGCVTQTVNVIARKVSCEVETTLKQRYALGGLAFPVGGRSLAPF